MSRLDRETWSNAPTLPTPAPARAFGGSTYSPPRDYDRLSGQLLRVFHVIRRGDWWTLEEISKYLNFHDSEAAISARIRDLRKDKYGGHTVERESVGNGLFRYRLIVNRSKRT